MIDKTSRFWQEVIEGYNQVAVNHSKTITVVSNSDGLEAKIYHGILYDDIFIKVRSTNG